MCVGYVPPRRPGFRWFGWNSIGEPIFIGHGRLLPRNWPEGVGTPTLGPQSSILGEMMIIGLTSDSTSLRDLRTLADWTIRPRLLSIGGVAQVTVIGGEMKEYQILLDLPRMKQYGVTLDEVLNAAREMNRNANGGILYESV